MNIFQSIVLGVIQGITEFLPISSSGHLDVIPQIFNWSAPSTNFIVMLHLGTLFALLLHYRLTIIGYFNAVTKSVKKSSNLTEAEKIKVKSITLVLLATIPAAIIGFIFEKTILHIYDGNLGFNTSLIIIAIPMLVIGIIFLIEEKFIVEKEKEIHNLSGKNALLIGFAQAFALIRGVSRSGITIITGRLNGLSRVSAAEFSFLMSIPITALVTIYGLISLGTSAPTGVNTDLLSILVGAFAAFVSGLLAISFLIKFLKNRTLKIFGTYRICFAIFIFLVLISK